MVFFRSDEQRYLPIAPSSNPAKHSIEYAANAGGYPGKNDAFATFLQPYIGKKYFLMRKSETIAIE